MTDSAIGAVYNYLTANLSTALAVADPKVSVSDGWPDNPEAQRQFVFGRSAPATGETQAAGTPALVSIGAGLIDETFSVPCFIQIITGGQMDQDMARNAALTIWNAFLKFIMSDLTLGGSLSAGWAAINQFQMEGTPNDFLGSGRACLITFDLVCKNQYAPLS